MRHPQKTITDALEGLGAELGFSEADFGGRLGIERKVPIIASRHRHVKSREAQR